MADTGTSLSLAAFARGDAGSIVEWVAYHRAIGATHLTIYGGDDSPMPLLKALAPYLLEPEPRVTLLQWGPSGTAESAGRHFLAQPPAGWRGFLGAHEFLAFPGSDDAAAFLGTVTAECATVTLPMRLFGDNHRTPPSDDFVLFARTRRAEALGPETRSLARGEGGDRAVAGVEQAYVAHFARQPGDGLNAVEDHTLAALWAERTAHPLATHPLATHPLATGTRDGASPANVALRKPTRQSSRYEGGTGSHLAHAEGRANDGFVSGHFGFHTKYEDAPWWMVDLLDVFLLREMRIVNRGDNPAIMNRAANLSIEVSTDGAAWEQAGTLDGYDWTEAATPELTLQFTGLVLARLVRITSRTPTMLHLDEVEIYGEKFG